MTLIARLRSFIRALVRPAQVDADMDQELRFHVDARIDDLAANGLTRDEAAAQARRELGDFARWKEQGRDARGVRVFDELRADLRYAARQLGRAPVFTLAAAASLTLGIGANVAIFSLANAVLIKPLPIARPAEVVQVIHAGQRGASGSSNYGWFQSLQARRDVFASLFGVRMQQVIVQADGAVDRVLGQRVIGDYYGTLGIQPQLGRLLNPADPSADRLVVISDRYWQRRFGRNAGVIGRRLTIDGAPFEVAGVTPPGFFGVQVGRMMDVTTLLDVKTFGEANSWTTVPLIGRLRPGVSIDAAQRELSPVLERFAVERGLSDRGRQAQFQRVELPSAQNGLSDLRDQFGQPLRLLLAVVAVLLALACVNLAGLLIARNASRERELRTRLALGASRGRILRQLLTESGLLGALGGTVGLAGGWISSRALVAMLPDAGWPRSLATDVDGVVLLFTSGVAILTVVLFGVWPAWRAARTHVVPVPGSRVTSVATGVGRLLAAVQIALGVMLIAGAVLFLRTLLNLSRLDAGFARDGVVVASLNLADPAVADPIELQRALLDRLRALPGVEHATVGTMTPLNGHEEGRPVFVPGSRAPLEEERGLPPVLGAPVGVAQVDAVGSQYFETFGIDIVAGRGIVDRDLTAGSRVAVVSQTFARRHYADSSPLGRRFEIRGANPAEYEIVGVARDVRYRGLRQQDPPPLVYVAQLLEEDEVDVAIRTSAGERQAIAMLPPLIRSLAPGYLFLDATSVSERIGESLWQEHLLAALCGFFAVVAAILASIGTYALLAHLVARRRVELGVRAALGAETWTIAWMIVRQALLLAASGAAAGLVLARLSLGVLDSMLFGVPPDDIPTLAMSAGLLVGIAVLAAVGPAWRAARIDPLVALRAD